MSEQPRQEIDPQLLHLAARALGLAKHGDMERAARMAERISREYPEDGVIVAALAWCDELIRHAPALDFSRRPDEILGLKFKNASTGEISDADGAPPHIAWAGQFLNARARRDAETGQALINGSADGRQFGDRVLGLLEVVALGLTVQTEHIVTADGRPAGGR